MAVEAFKAIFEWLKGKRAKPLLIHGPLSSGKKTIIRKAFEKKGFVVWEPKEEDLDWHYDSGMLGKYAYIMRMEEVGVKTLPNVKQAPVIYVCHNPYDFGLTKPELESKFEMKKLDTKLDLSQKGSNSEKDSEPSYWDAVRAIVNPYSPFVKKAFYAEKAGDYFPQVVFNSYLKSGGLGKMEASEAANSLSLVDAYFGLGDPENGFVGRQYANTLGVIHPIMRTGLTPDKLVIPTYKPKGISEKSHMLSYKTIYPKNLHPVEQPAPKEKPKKKRKQNTERQKKPKKAKAPVQTVVTTFFL